MTSLTDAMGQSLDWTYDPLGRRSTQDNRDGTTVAWTHDGAGRILTRAAPGTATVTYTYDDNGNWLTAGDGVRTITTIYDRLNRPTQVTVSDDASADTSYSYSFTTPTRSDASGSYSASLDRFGREISFLDPIHGGSAWTTTYRADGQLATFAAPNGNTTTWTYDQVGRPTRNLTEGPGGVDRADYVYTVNRAGQRMAEASTITGDPTNGTVNFTYDAVGRVTGYSGTSVTSQTYAWDKVASRTSKQVGGGATVTTTYNNANRPTSDSGGGAYSNDLDGRLTGRPGQTLVWDALGRLIQVKDPTSANISTYTYDPLDRLLTVSNAAGLTKFRYVGQSTQIAQARDLNNVVLYNVGTSLAGGALMDWGAGGSNQRFYGQNGHGDLTWTAGSTGTVTATLRSDPWGMPGTSSGGSLPSFRFQSSWYDTSSSLSWAVTRWYAPSLGRFVSEDSLLGEPSRPGDRHLYAYGAGEPVGRADRDGRFWRWVRFGETLADISQKTYGFVDLNRLIRANPGGEITPVRLTPFNIRVAPPQCLWIPYRNDPNQCRPLRADWPYNDRLYQRFFAARDFTLQRMFRDGRDPSVGFWRNDLLGLITNPSVLALFGMKVCGTCDWDLKVPLQNDFGFKHERRWTAVFGDPAPESLLYDAWGNIHYGYVGRAHGIPAWILRAGAIDFGGIDSVSDRRSVDIGIELWELSRFNVFRFQLGNAVRDSMLIYRSDPRPNAMLNLLRG